MTRKSNGKMFIGVFLLTCSLVYQISCFEIHRDNCRRYSVFKLNGKGIKVTGGLMKLDAAASLSNCVRECHKKNQCRSINFKSNSLDNNCEILDNIKSTGTITPASDWKHYEPISLTVRFSVY